MQKYIRTEILGIYGTPNYRNTGKSLEILETQRKTRKENELNKKSNYKNIGTTTKIHKIWAVRLFIY